MNLLNKDNRSSLYINIAASILFVFILQPIMGLFWDFLNKAGPFVTEYFVNALYKNAALGQRSWVIVVLLFIGFAIILDFTLGDVIRLEIRLFRINSKSKANLTENEEEIDLKEDINIKNSNKKSQKKTQNISIKSRILIWITTIAFLFIIFYVMLLIFSDLQMNSSFNQRVKIISPVIDEQTEEEIIAEWSKMERREDYLMINKNIEDIAEKNNLKLPDLLYK